MTDQSDIFKQGIEQMAALAQSWMKTPGLNQAAPSGAHMKTLAGLTSDLQGLYAEAYRRHLDPFLTGNRKIAEHFAALTRSRDPRDFADFQLEIMGLVMEGASIRAEAWGDLADKVGHRYADFVRALAADLQGGPTEAEAPQGKGAGTGAAKPATAKAAG